MYFIGAQELQRLSAVYCQRPETCIHLVSKRESDSEREGNYALMRICRLQINESDLRKVATLGKSTFWWNNRINFFFVRSTLIARTLVRCCVSGLSIVHWKNFELVAALHAQIHTHTTENVNKEKGCRVVRYFAVTNICNFLLPNMNEISIQFVYCSCDIRAKLITTANGENKAVYKLQTPLVRLWSRHCQP